MTDRTTNLVLLCLAILSGVLNYAGLALFVPRGNLFQLVLCAMTGFGVTIVLALFWSNTFRILPDLITPRRRAGGWIMVGFGMVAILSISTYWNLIAIAGGEIARLGSTDVVLEAERAFANAVEASGMFQSFMADIAAFSGDVANQVAVELGGGNSGGAGQGPISNSMAQVGDRLTNLTTALAEGSSNLTALRAEGDQCLAALNSALNLGNSEGVAAQIACTNAVIGDLGNQNMLAAIERGMRSLTEGIVLPATIRTDAQRAIIGGFMAESQLRADGIAAMVATLDVPVIDPVSAATPNRMAGVLVHWQSILPALFTAAAIDLLPLVLLVFRVLHEDDRRGRDMPQGDLNARDLIDALRQINLLQKEIAPKAVEGDEFIDLPDEDWEDIDPDGESNDEEGDPK